MRYLTTTHEVTFVTVFTAMTEDEALENHLRMVEAGLVLPTTVSKKAEVKFS